MSTPTTLPWGPDELHLTFAGEIRCRRPDGADRWVQQLNVIGGNDDLIPRCRAEALGDQLAVVRSDGEHWRGATTHDPRTHLLDRTRGLRCSHDWWTVGRIALLREGVLLLEVNAPSPYAPPLDPPLTVRLVEPATGDTLQAWPVGPTGALAATVQAKDAWELRATLAFRDGRWGVAIGPAWSPTGDRVEPQHVRVRGVPKRAPLAVAFEPRRP